ncbi:hypothetical protein GALL_355940 [mine drainage metagenome]|uniref:Uncharacterized protein n=1 Tax=mine drainage metagenome TaxID=410659 RepID=A0A1J5QYS7_9ZZZZ
MVDAELLGVVAVLVGDARRDHDHRQVARALVGANVAREVEAVHARHLDVGQHDVGQRALQLLERVEAVLGQHHVVAVAAEEALGHAAHRDRVVDHQHGVGRHQRQIVEIGLERARRAGAGARLVHQPRGLRAVHRGQRDRVVDQHQAAFGQQRHPGQTRYARQLRAEVLDHDFLVAEHFVDQQRDALRRRTHQHQWHAAPGGLGAGAAVAGQRAEPVAGQLVVGVAPVALLRRAGGLGRLDAHDAVDQVRRHRVDAVADAQQHDLRHRGGQRQHQREGAAAPRRRLHFDAAAERARVVAHDVESDAAAGHRVGFAHAGKAGAEDQLVQLRGVGLRVGREQAEAARTRGDRRVVEPGAVVSHRDAHFAAFLAHAQAHRSGRRLARGGALRRRFQPVRDRVAQQVVEGAGHSIQHAAVDLDGAADDVERDRLARVLAGLAHRAVQALGDAVELDHARAQQIALQVAGQARLARQVVVGGLQGSRQRVLHQRQVVDRLGHHPRQFLEAREAIELERVEVAAVNARGLRARGHLRVGLQFDVAHLGAQPLEVVAEVAAARADLAEFGFQTRARDADFADLIDQAVEQRGAHAHRLRGQPRARRGLRRWRRGRRRIKRRAGHRRRRSCRRGRGRRRCLVHRLAGRRLWRSPELAFAQTLEARGQRVAACGQFEHRAGVGHAVGAEQRFDVGFQPMRGVAQHHRAGHARAALERVQQAHRLLRRGCVVRLRLPAPQRRRELRQQLGGFELEHREQLGVDRVDQFGRRAGKRRDTWRRARRALRERRSIGRRGANAQPIRQRVERVFQRRRCVAQEAGRELMQQAADVVDRGAEQRGVARVDRVRSLALQLDQRLEAFSQVADAAQSDGA